MYIHLATDLVHKMCACCSRALERKSRIISGPSNFSHIMHMGPDQGMKALIDLPVVSSCLAYLLSLEIFHSLQHQTFREINMCQMVTRKFFMGIFIGKNIDWLTEWFNL